MFDTGILGGACRSGCLLDLVATFFPKISDQKYAMRPFKCRFKGLWAVQVCFDDFIADLAMLVWITGQRAYLESGLRVSARTLNCLFACRARTTAPPCCPVAPITAISFLFVRSICRVPLSCYLLMKSLLI